MIGITAAACPLPEVRNTLMMVFAISIAGPCKIDGTEFRPAASECTTVSVMWPAFMMPLIACAIPMMKAAPSIFLHPSRNSFEIWDGPKPAIAPIMMAMARNTDAVSSIFQSRAMPPYTMRIRDAKNVIMMRIFRASSAPKLLRSASLRNSLVLSSSYIGLSSGFF